MQMITDYGLPSKRWIRKRLVEHRGKVLKQLYLRTRLKEKALGQLGISSSKGVTLICSDGYEGDIQKNVTLANEVSAAWDYINHRWATYVKYVNGGGTWYAIPEQKKERRKELRRWRSLPLQHYEQIADEEQEWATPSDIQISCKVPNFMTNLQLI